MHRRAHQAKDLRNVMRRVASAARFLLAPAVIALVASCDTEERSTGPGQVAVVPVAAAPDANARLVLTDNVPDSLKALSRSGSLVVSDAADGTLANALRGARVLASSLANMVIGEEPLVSATAIPFAPESGLPANLGPACDDCVMTDVPIGFSFSFFGSRYDRLDISSNGFVRFGTPPVRSQSGCCIGGQIPRAEGSSLDNMISIAWTDWWPTQSGKIRYETRGTAPNRRFLVQFSDVPTCCTATSTMRITSQIILYEGTGVAEVHTTSIAGPRRAITQGVENETGTVAAFVPGRVATSFALTRDAVRFVTQRANSLPVLAAGGNAGSPEDHYEGEEGSAITFVASANDPDGDVLSYAWDFDGDGTTDATTATASHVFPDNGEFTATVSVNDGQAGRVSASVPVRVANVAPVVNAGSDLMVTAGDVVPLALSFTDAGQSDYDWTYTVLWGDDADGPSSSSGTLDGQGQFGASHTYNVPGAYRVTILVRDKDGAEGSSSVTVTADNRAPVASAGANAGGPPADRYSGVEGRSVAFDASASSDADGDALHYSWNFGDRTSDVEGVRAEHVFGDDGSYVATVTVTDGRGGSTVATVPVEIGNANPTATFAAPSGPLSEGSPFALSLSGALDVAADLDELRYSFDCGGGFAVAGSPATGTCTPDDNGTLTVRGRVEDADGGASEYVASVSVVNVAPTGVFTTPPRVTVGTPIVLGFSSASDPSSADRAALRFEFDCGTGAGFSLDAVCPTTAVGAQRVSGRVLDKDGGESSYGPYGVTIEPAATSLIITDVRVQYSDPATLSATLASNAGASAGPLAGAVEFFVDGASVGSVPVADAATVTLGPLADSRPVGSYSMSASFTPAAGSNYAASRAVGSLTVEREELRVDYTGDLYAKVSGAPTAVATVRLAATLTQDPDGSLGDLSLASVRFELYRSTNSGSTPDKVVEGVAVDRTGNAQASAALPAGGWTVRAVVPASNGYWNAMSAGLGTITVTVGGGKGHRVTGGGTISSTTKASESRFTFDVTDAAKKNAAGGDVQIVIRGGDGYDYKVKSSSWSGATLSFSSDYSRARFTTRASVQKLNARTGKVVSTTPNYSLTVDAFDGGGRSRKSADRLAYTIIDPAGRVWRQVGSGNAPVAVGGRVQVRSGGEHDDD